MGQYIDFAYVKTNADFKVVLQDYGVDFKMNGSSPEIRCHCPFHDDENPSMSVNLDRKLFTCHAASCGVKGNILEFVDLMEDHPGLRQAAQILADMCGIEVAPPKPVKKPARRKAADRDQSPKVEPRQARRSRFRERFKNRDKPAGEPKVFPAPVDETVPDIAINEPLGFTLQLDRTHEYATSRGLSSSAVERFEMGYCSRGTMKDRWCVPIHDTEGQLVAYSGRWVSADRPKDEPKYKLPKNFNKNLVLFNLHRVLAAREHLAEQFTNSVVIVEGIFDAVRLYEYGAPAVALLGSSISDAQVALIREHFRYAYVMLDGGEDEARMKVVDRLSQEIFVRSVVLPPGEDPESVDDEYFIEALPGIELS